MLAVRRWPETTAVLASAGLLLAGCGGAAHLRSEPGATRPHRPAPLAVPPQQAVRPSCRAEAAVGPRRAESYAALVRKDAVIRLSPGSGPILARVGRIDVNGYPTVLGVVGARRTPRACAPVAYRVQLPVPPNNRSGWISAGAVRVFTVTTRVVVDLPARRLVAYRAGEPVLRARVAIGSPQTPTPRGRYFVNERWLLASPDGPFGVAALGISAHSDVLRNWVEGGPIALHGTNEPATIGQAVSHGCIRLANADMRRLLRLAPAGTVVVIRG
ncbi:MAG TPA: L,D-transpeptidase [Gaiellaceae bacterium]|nr:L,D-transpeptidase [Gaiellaceae bacterium]